MIDDLRWSLNAQEVAIDLRARCPHDQGVTMSPRPYAKKGRIMHGSTLRIRGHSESNDVDAVVIGSTFSWLRGSIGSSTSVVAIIMNASISSTSLEWPCRGVGLTLMFHDLVRIMATCCAGNHSSDGGRERSVPDEPGRHLASGNSLYPDRR